MRVHVFIDTVVGVLRPNEGLEASAAAAETERGVGALPRHRVQLQFTAEISRVQATDTSKSGQKTRGDRVVLRTHGLRGWSGHSNVRGGARGAVLEERQVYTAHTSKSGNKVVAEMYGIRGWVGTYQ